jgi:hypothetical protein
MEALDTVALFWTAVILASGMVLTIGRWAARQTAVKLPASSKFQSRHDFCRQPDYRSMR